MASSASEELDQLIQEMDSGSLDYRFSESFLGKVRRLTRNCRGTPEAQRADRFLERIQAIQESGFAARIVAVEVPPGYHLRLWDNETESWDPADVEPGLPGQLRWKPGDAVKIGLERTDPHNVGNAIQDVWEVTGRWSLFMIHEQGGRHVFRGNFAVAIEFPELSSALPRL
jgi:hypothetical protein